jgi:hypothetical protein
MTLQQAPAAPATEMAHPLLRVVLLAALVIVAIVAVTAIVGVAGAGPSMDIVADPAGVTLPF